MENSEENIGQISRFYQTELLSSEECGAFLTNVEIANIANSMNIEVTLTSNEFILPELFKLASADNRLSELNELLVALFEDRLAEYKNLKNLYSKAQEPITMWIEKCERTIEKIKSGAVKNG